MKKIRFHVDESFRFLCSTLTWWVVIQGHKRPSLCQFFIKIILFYESDFTKNNFSDKIFYVKTNEVLNFSNFQPNNNELLSHHSFPFPTKKTLFLTKKTPSRRLGTMQQKGNFEL
jgi:hypothetical protein